MLSVTDALDLVLARAARLEPQEVALADACGRTVAAPALASVDLPPFPSSSMDGFAVRAADLPGTLAIVGESAAGRPAERPVGTGEAIRIATGAVVPDGADAVVPIESSAVTGETVAFLDNCDVGSCIRPRGGDVGVGDVVLVEGTTIRAPQVGALAAAGITAVTCARIPHVAVLSTGTELRLPGAPLGPGQIYDANGPMLRAQLESAGARVEVVPAVRDDPQALAGALERGLQADVLITTGGVSVGPHDLVRRAESELGVEEVFWRVAVRPGKPIAFGVRGATLVFGLPGNPVSALVGFELFIRPALRALQGAADPRPPFLPGRLTAPVRRDGRETLLRARATVEDGVVLLEPLRGQESHMIARTATANALVLVPSGEGELATGDTVSYLVI